jgi:hypothetical protein
MQINLFDYINSINNKSKLKDPDFINYVPFVVNRALAQHKSTILIAQELNLLPTLTSEQHFNYAFNSVSKGKRFGKWSKKEEYSDDEINISKFFNVNLEAAREYRIVISEAELEHINRHYTNDKPDPKKPDKQP